LSFDLKPRLASGLRQFPNDLVELRGEGAKDLGHHDAIQSNPIDGQIVHVGEYVVVEGVAMRREKHEVAPPRVVG
jgi:hypothetical protein